MSRKILLVDDDPEMLALLRETLNPFGAIFKASNGKDALRLVSEERPRLIILDVEIDVAVAQRALEDGARAYMTKRSRQSDFCSLLE